MRKTWPKHFMCLVNIYFSVYISLVRHNRTHTHFFLFKVAFRCKFACMHIFKFEIAVECFLVWLVDCTMETFDYNRTNESVYIAYKFQNTDATTEINKNRSNEKKKPCLKTFQFVTHYLYISSSLQFFNFNSQYKKKFS